MPVARALPLFERAAAQTPVEFGHDFIRATESLRIIGRGGVSALHFARVCAASCGDVVIEMKTWTIGASLLAGRAAY